MGRPESPNAPCREGLTALYLRLPEFLPELAIAKGDGRYGKVLTTLAKTDLLILDDWGLAPLSEEHRRDLLEIIEDRHDCRATLVTSQLPVEHWHEALGDPTLADAILDRLVHNAYNITLQGDSMRKRPARLTKGAARRIILYRPASLRSEGGRLHLEWVATFPWSTWQASRGLGGRFPMD